MEDRHLTLGEVAGAMGVSERTVRRWIKSGKLRAYKPGRDYRIPESAVRTLVEESEITPKAPGRSSREPSLFNGLEDERPTREPLTPKLRRRAAWARRAELEGVLEHLTLRTETLRDQANQSHEATDEQGLWALFLDSLLLVEGAESLLASNREEAQELGDETAEERRLRGRLEHRTEDLDEVNDRIGNMWAEASHARSDAENEVSEHDHAVPQLEVYRRKRAG